MKPWFWFLKNYQQDKSEFSAPLSPFHIRAAIPGDLTELAEIIADSFYSRQGIGSWVYPVLRLGIYEDLQNRLSSISPRYACLVAVVPTTNLGRMSDRLVGTVEMALRPTRNWPFCRSLQSPYLSNLAVHHDCRRQGAAGQLLLTCEGIAIGWGFQDLYLHVMENNYQAKRLYFKLGYRLHRVDSSWFSLLLGQPRRLLLHKHLAATTTVAPHET